MAHANTNTNTNETPRPRRQTLDTLLPSPGKITFRPGYVLALEFSSTGGVSYRRQMEREELQDQRLEVDFFTKKVVDHVELNKISKKIINQAYHVISKHAAHTPIGYWADFAAFAEIVEELRRVQTAAAQFNLAARALNSRQRVEVSVYPMELAEDNESAATRIAQDVRDRLVDIKAALAAGDRKGFEIVMGKCNNLDKLATGIQADAIRMALDHARALKTQLLEALRQNFSPEQCAPLLDLEPIDAAIALFTDTSVPL